MKTEITQFLRAMLPIAAVVLIAMVVMSVSAVSEIRPPAAHSGLAAGALQSVLTDEQTEAPTVLKFSYGRTGLDGR